MRLMKKCKYCGLILRVWGFNMFLDLFEFSKNQVNYLEPVGIFKPFSLI